MGIVFEAAREEDGLQKTVAIKVLTASILDRSANSQFRRERQVLNELSHPNIAQLFDWGMTPDHRAYLVMEFVGDAKPIDAYCAAAGLGVAEILRVFLGVCAAVSHAHGR